MKIKTLTFYDHYTCRQGHQTSSSPDLGNLFLKQEFEYFPDVFHILWVYKTLKTTAILQVPPSDYLNTLTGFQVKGMTLAPFI